MEGHTLTATSPTVDLLAITNTTLAKRKGQRPFKVVSPHTGQSSVRQAKLGVITGVLRKTHVLFVESDPIGRSRSDSGLNYVTVAHHPVTLVAIEEKDLLIGG